MTIATEAEAQALEQKLIANKAPATRGYVVSTIAPAVRGIGTVLREQLAARQTARGIGAAHH